MSLEPISTSTLDQPYWHAVIYGPPKTGKTSFLATLPAPLVVSMDEDGMTSLRSKQVDFVEPATWLELSSIVSNIEPTIKDGSFRYRDKVYSSLAFDPLNRMQDLVYASIQKPGKTLTLPDRGFGNDKLTAMFRKLCSMDIHVVFTCLERFDKDEHTGRVKVTFDISPALGRRFPAIPSFIWHTNAEPQGSGVTKYTISTQNESYYEAGGRYGDKAPPLRVDPDFMKLYDYVCGRSTTKATFHYKGH